MINNVFRISGWNSCILARFQEDLLVGGGDLGAGNDVHDGCYTNTNMCFPRTLVFLFWGPTRAK